MFLVIITPKMYWMPITGKLSLDYINRVTLEVFLKFFLEKVTFEKSVNDNIIS